MEKVLFLILALILSEMVFTHGNYGKSMNQNFKLRQECKSSEASTLCSEAKTIRNFKSNFKPISREVRKSSVLFDNFIQGTNFNPTCKKDLAVVILEDWNRS